MNFAISSDVTFDETMVCPSSRFERAGDHEVGEPLFDDEDEGAEGMDNPAPAPPAVPQGAASTMTHGPDTSSSWGPWDLPPRAVPFVPEEAPATVEGEATSAREAPRHIQRQHLPQQMISNIDERVTRSRQISHFAHSAFVADFEPRDFGHALTGSDWVNAMHEELENFERNRVWVLVSPPSECHPIGTKWVFKKNMEKMAML